MHEHECAAHASDLVQRAVLAAGCTDRPRVSDDNAFAETLLRTLKYRPAYPRGGFADLAAGRAWVLQFVRWYNTEHRHSALGFVTPEQHHTGAHVTIFAQRQALYKLARAQRPERWSSAVRDWTPPGPVTLNPAGVAAQPLAQAA